MLPRSKSAPAKRLARDLVCMLIVYITVERC